MPAVTPESLFTARLTANPGGPLVTFYDDASGERAELSAKSLGNWIAKTHFLLIDELGLGVGGRAYVVLPVHWLAVPILLGCWFAGLEVTTSPTGADVAFGDPASLERADLDGIGDIYAVSLRSMARSAEPPTGMSDYAGAVRPQPDSWASVNAQAGPDDPALDGLTRSGVASRAAAVATVLGLGAGGRLLWAGDRLDGPDWIAAVLAPLSVSGSVVLVRNANLAGRDRLIAAEHITVTAAG